MLSDYLKYLIILLVISILLYTLVENKVKESKGARKINLIYSVGMALSLGLVPFTWYLGLQNNTFVFLAVEQLLVLIIGIAHIQLMYKLLPWTSPVSFLWELVYSFKVVCLGMLFQILSLVVIGLGELLPVVLSSFIWFFVPFLFFQVYTIYKSIPAKKFKEWFFPVNQSITPPSDSDMASPVVIAFEFTKSQEDKAKTVFRAKAPLQMQLGRLFYYFINDYNERNPENNIEVVYDNSNPFGWVFYEKPKLLGCKRYLDFERTIDNNGIKENSIIVCKRTN